MYIYIGRTKSANESLKVVKKTQDSRLQTENTFRTGKFNKFFSLFFLWKGEPVVNVTYLFSCGLFSFEKKKKILPFVATSNDFPCQLNSF